MIEEVIYSPDGKSWIRQQEYEMMKRLHVKARKHCEILLASSEAWEKHKMRQVLKADHRKYAIIIVGKTQFLAAVHNITYEAYKIDGYNWTWMKWKTFKFVRWATGFDV